MRSKFKYLLAFLGIFVLMIIPKNVFASENFTGAFTLYNKWTSNGTLGTGYDNTNAGISYPNTSSWLDLPAYTGSSYRVVTAMDIQANYNFVGQNGYTLYFHFENGGYVHPAWPYNSSQAWFIDTGGCPGKQCSVSWSYVQGSLDLTINFIATSNSSSVLFTLGNFSDNMGMFYNAYTSTQGLRISSSTLDEVENSINFDPVIQSQEQLTQDIINNNNQNTTNIINNQNSNTEKEIESQKVCHDIDLTINADNKNNFTIGLLASDGSIASNDDSYRVSSFIPVNSGRIYTYTISTNQSNLRYCLYNSNKTLISCNSVGNTRSLSTPITPTQDGFIRFTAPVTSTNYGSIVGVSCINGNQALNDSLTDSNVEIGGELLGDVEFYENSYFSSIITSPISFLNSLNGQCTPVVLPLFGKNISLPCGTTIFWDLDNTYITNFRAFWNILFGGLIIYRLALSLIIHINDALDPTKDKIGGLEV